MDTARVNSFNTLVAVPFLSRRFAMKRFLGLTSEELAENERQWKEENVDIDVTLPASAEMRGQGLTANNISGDINTLQAATSQSVPQPAAGEPVPAATGAETPGGAGQIPPA